MAWRFDLFPASILFRRPTDASFVFGIAIAFLVGHCLADYARDGLPALRPFSSAWLAIVGSAVAFSARTGHALHAAREALISAVIMLATGLFLLAMRQERHRAPTAAVVVLAHPRRIGVYDRLGRHLIEDRRTSTGARCSERRCDVIVVRDIVAVVQSGAGINWKQPQAIYAKLGDVIELLG